MKTNIQPVGRVLCRVKSVARRRAVLAAAAALAACTGGVAHATEFFWDTNNASAGAGGTGIWDTAATNWAPASGGLTATAAWVDSATNDATFQAPITPIGAIGTVTVSGARTVGTLTFGATAAAQNYLITGGTITISNTAQGILMATNTSGTNTGEVILSNITGTDLVVARNMSANGTLLNIGGGGNTGTTVASYTGNLILGGTGTGNTYSTSNKVSIGNATALPQGAGNNILFKQDASQLLFTGGTAIGNANAAYQASFNNNINLNASGTSTVFNSAIGAATTGTIITFTGLISGTSDLTFGVGLSGGQGKIVLNHPGGMTYTGQTKLLMTSAATTSGIIALGANDQLPVGSQLIFAGTTAADAAFDMAGFNQRVGGLTSTTTGNIPGVTNSTGTLSTFTIDGNVTTGSYAGTIGIPVGTTGVAGATDNIRLALASTNTGITNLTKANTYNGGTQIDGGTLLVNNTSGSATGTGTVTINAGGKLGGTGSVSGAVTNSGKIAPGNSVGTINLAGGLTLNADSTNDFEFASTPANDRINVTAGTLTLPGSGTAKLDLIDTGTAIRNATYTLISYAGATLSGVPNTALSVVPPSSGPAQAASFAINNNVGASTIELIVSGAGNLLTWKGDGTGSGAWDVGGTSNWFNTETLGTTVFANNDYVTLDDTANGSGPVAIAVDAGGVSPSGLIVNNSTRQYTLSGGPVGGNTKITKSGTGTLVLASSNTYTGGTSVSAGTLAIASDASLGAVPGSPSTNLTLAKGSSTSTILRIDGDTTLNANRNILLMQSGGGGPTISTDFNVTIAGKILGGTTAGVNLVKGGTGTLTLLGDNSTNVGGGFVNAMIVNAGALKVAQDVSLGQLTKAVTLNSGTLQLGASFNPAGRPLTIASGGGTVDTNGFNATLDGVVSGSSAFTKAGAGTLALSATNNTFSGTVNVNAGTLQLLSNLTTPAAVNVTGGTMEIAAGAGSARILRTTAVGVTNGRLDIQDNKLITKSPVGTWNGTAYTDVTGLIASGRSGNTWSGNGIVTSQSNAVGSNYTSVAIAKGSEVKTNSVSETALWAGQTITGTDTLVMYTYGGDATLDGKINIDDYVKIDSGIAGGYTGWVNGDFNYDGKVSIDDYITVIDANIGNQSGVFFTAGGATGGLSGVSAVPEPASIALLGLGAMGLIGSRRRRSH